jgi:23S rRNA pseudouridine1911/1915/1917 synthase
MPIEPAALRISSPSILFEDQHLVVLSKPAGLLSQGEKTGDENLVDWLRGHFGRNYVGLIHRLDRNTSGIMVVAKRSKAAQRLTDALQSGVLRRSYLAWLGGSFPPEQMQKPQKWRHFLSKDERTNTVRVVKEPEKAGAKTGTTNPKEALLSLSPLLTENFEGQVVTLAEFVLETGRSHQIRAQAAYEKHALLGDAKYGGMSGFPRPALHSYRLEFPHPMSKERMSFIATLPEDFRSVSKSTLLDKVLSRLEPENSREG